MADPMSQPGESLVYFCGRDVPIVEARVPISDHGVLYGLGFFETFRTSAGRPHAWSRHRCRLEAACRRAGIVLPSTFLAGDEERLTAVIRRQLAAHGLTEAVFRYTVTAGAPSASGLYDQPAEWLVLRPLPPAAPAEGVALRTLQLTRDNGEWLPRPKSLNYANSLLGASELNRRARRPDDEGLFTARDSGFVVEAVRQNLAWIAQGRLCYPDPALGAVEGTCLQWVLQHHPAAVPRRVSPAELASAEAVMIMNAVRGVTPVARLWDRDDRETIGEWRSAENPIVIALREAWVEALRETARRPV